MAKLTGSDLTQKTPAARNATSAAIWACILRARQEGAHRFDFGSFDRKSAESILAGQGPPADLAGSHNYLKWSFGGEIALLPRPQFILTGRLTRLALVGAAQRLLASDAVRWLAHRVRAARRPAAAPAVQASDG